MTVIGEIKPKNMLLMEMRPDLSSMLLLVVINSNSNSKRWLSESGWYGFSRDTST
ncbi:hypothetical protein VE00_07691 [Pseudogymnoascus sp. WSF 3629]|nr:hypothetical protein VE00_07691 [Pseudogymnoascus sp. WSF 3629]